MKRLFTIAAMLFVLALLAVPAHAQMGTMCCFGAIGNNPFDYILAPLETQPAFGFSVYSTPAWPFYLYLNLTKTWGWTSTCPQGGIATGKVTTVPDQVSNPQIIDQVNVDTTIANPQTGFIQGRFSGIALVFVSTQPPSFGATINEGGPCSGAGRRDEVQTATPQ